MMFPPQQISLSMTRSLRILLLGAALMTPALPLQAQGITLPRPDISYFDVNDNAIEQAARVLGFMLGQTAALQSVMQQHPDLVGDSKARMVAFDATFSFPAQRAEWFLEDAVGAEPTQKFLASTADKAEDSIVQLTRTDARTFLAEVEQRLDGVMDEPSLKAMLWLRYARDPADEMREWRQRFSSKGHPKAAGVNMSLEAPLSWRQDEGNRPHVLAKWMSQNGSGAMGITLLVREYPGIVSMEELEEVETTNDWASMIPDDQTVLDGQVVVIDRQPAVQIDTKGQTRTLDTRLSHSSRNYMVFLENRFVSLQCMFGYAPDTDEKIVASRFRGLQELCRRVAITITFPDTYR